MFKKQDYTFNNLMDEIKRKLLKSHESKIYHDRNPRYFLDVGNSWNSFIVIQGDL